MQVSSVHNREKITMLVLAWWVYELLDVSVFSASY